MDDLISRQAAVDLIERMKPYHQDQDDIAEMLQNMPSAQPEPCADAVSRADAIDAVGLGDSVRRIKDRIAKLPSVMPVRDCTGCRFSFLAERTEDG